MKNKQIKHKRRVNGQFVCLFLFLFCFVLFFSSVFDMACYVLVIACPPIFFFSPLTIMVEGNFPDSITFFKM